MPEAKCWDCHMYFEYDASDDRPFIYHEHPDGTMVAVDNPNLIKRKKPWNPALSYKKKKTHWQDWGY